MNVIISVITIFIFTARITFLNPEGHPLRRIKSPREASEGIIKIPEEYKGTVEKLSAGSENARLVGIQEIVTIVTEKERNKNKREALALQLVNTLSDPQEIVQEAAARALKNILPSYDEQFQILVGLKIVEKLGDSEEYLRRSAQQGLKKIMPSLEMTPRRVIALQIIARWLYSPLEYASFSAMVTLRKILDYLDYDSQKAVVEKLQENLTSEEKREVTVKTFSWITPSLRAKVIEDLELDIVLKEELVSSH